MPLFVSWKKSEETSDELLLKRFMDSGDPDLLGILYERYMHLVYGVCMKYFEESEKARDGVISIFEKLIIELPKHNVENFKSWLYVLTKNFCLMKLRSEKSEHKKMEQWQSEQDIFVESVEEVHPIDEDSESLNNKLQECVNKLKEDQNRCIRLFYYENRSYKEISEALRLDEKKVKSLIQNGKRNLKICIEGKNG